jgi:hypothetical protein
MHRTTHKIWSDASFITESRADGDGLIWVDNNRKEVFKGHFFTSSCNRSTHAELMTGAVFVLLAPKETCLTIKCHNKTTSQYLKSYQWKENKDITGLIIGT